MDLRAALSLKDEVEAALERLVGAVRPQTPGPRPRARRALALGGSAPDPTRARSRGSLHGRGTLKAECQAM